jgi:RNA polymerase sigma-70 factor (ECF subfamily)
MKEFISYSDEELMREIKADNMLAFDALYKRYSKKVYQFGEAILRSQGESESLMQDVFLKLWEKRHSVKKDSSVKYYIFTTTYNSAISIIRKKAREAEYVNYLKSIQVVDSDPVDMELEYKELSDKLDEAIKRLPKRQREVYVLHKMKGFKYSEIAEQLNVSINTIENHMSSALKTIRKELQNYTLLSALFFYLFI